MWNKILNIIFTVVVVLILGFLIFCTCKYFSVNKEYQQYKENIENQIDSIKTINDSIENHLNNMYYSIDSLQFKVDSLTEVKQQIIIKKESFKINDNVLDGVELLKQNLSCVNL